MTTPIGEMFYHRLPPARLPVIPPGYTVDDMGARYLVPAGQQPWVVRDTYGYPVSWMFVSTETTWMPKANRFIRLDEGECYAWGAMTEPYHRGRGLFTALLVAAGQAMSGRGFELMWVGVAHGNEASRRANLRAGGRPGLELWRDEDGELSSRAIGPPLCMPTLVEALDA